MQRSWLDRLRDDRADHRDLDTMTEVPSGIGDDQRLSEAQLLLRRIKMAISTLPEIERQVFLLICVDNLSYREAAETLRMPMSAIRYRLARARLELRAALLAIQNDSWTDNARQL